MGNTGDSRPARRSVQDDIDSSPPTETTHTSLNPTLATNHTTDPNEYVSFLLVSNIHCPSCVSYVEDILRPVTEIIKIDISIVDHKIRVEHRGSVNTASIIAKDLTRAAFEVQHVITFDKNGRTLNEFNYPSSLPQPSKHGLFMSKAQRQHIENCNACRSKLENKNKRSKGLRKWWAISRQSQSGKKSSTQVVSKSPKSSDTTTDKPFIVDIALEKDYREIDEFESTINIGGMTCSSCSGTITEDLESLPIINSVNVNLMTNNATVTFAGPKSNIDSIVEVIEDLGYEASVDTIAPVAKPSQGQNITSKRFKTSLSIDGMTCGSCIGTITRGLEELPFVSNVNVDLVGNSGTVEFEGKEKLEEILAKIDDLGYDATVVKVEEVEPSVDDISKERTVTIVVDGMFCEHCPDRVVQALVSGMGDSGMVIEAPTLKDPRVTIKYTPSPPNVTLRRFISSITDAHEAFSAEVYHPPSLEERSRAMQHREQLHILFRVLFTFIIAIPTFIIGIVFMSLVPSTNKTRIWFEEPVWAGTVSRMEWALFIMTTPVMFFGADLFHRRTFKELKALWRPGSKVPILKRFYRFGSMNLLISAGTSVAYFASLAVLILDARTSPDEAIKTQGNNTYFDSVTFLSFFILIGRFLEAYSKARTGDAVAMLSSLRPSEALLVEESDNETTDEERINQRMTKRIPVELLEVSDVVNVPHGTSPPTDGKINQAGIFLFDESSLTGESKPVKKTLGDKVFSGSVNISQPVHMIVTDIGGTSMLDQIVAVVREGQGKRAPIERIADVITGYFAPVVTLIAIITFLTWLGLGESGTLPTNWLDSLQGGWTFWSLEFAIAVFVVACPCGIGLAAPTALFVGGGLAAKHGILVQGGGEAFQEASKMDVIVFDKTGTLTEGQMKVTDLETMDNENESQVDLQIAFTLSRLLEESSNHPIAKAIVDICAEKASDSIRILQSEIREISGQGMTGIFTLQVPTDKAGDDVNVSYEAAIGNQRLLSTIGGQSDSNAFLDQTLSKFHNLAQSTAIFSMRRTSTDRGTPEASYRPFLIFAISDPLRQTTSDVLKALQSNHDVEVHMCTGDNETTARAIAAQVGIPISHIRAGVLPQDKAAYIRELQHDSNNGKRRVVGFVGDGTNDTPALAAADVSIALSSGSDVAVNAASFILLNPDLQTVLELVRLAKRVFWRVKANFFWAAIYNLSLVPVAAGVFYPIGQWRLGPVWASAAMALSSVSVVCSSLALKLPEVQMGWKRRATKVSAR